MTPHAFPEWFHLALQVSLLIWIAWTMRDLPKFVQAFNSIGTQPVALIVLFVGCFLLVISKLYGIDTTIAGGVIGIAGNMLTGSGTPKHAPGETVETQTIQKISSPGAEASTEKPEP